jgi:hypothetical protein
MSNTATGADSTPTILSSRPDTERYQRDVSAKCNPIPSSLLLDTLVSLSLDCGVTSEELLLDTAEDDEEEATLLLDATTPEPATTIMVPDFVAFVEAPVVVIVYLYAPGAAVAETVPEI